MRGRLLVALAVLLALPGCALPVPTSAWTQVKVIYTAGSLPQQKGNYTLVIGPLQATLTDDNGTSTRNLPVGAWDSVVAATTALGARESQPCPGGVGVWVEAGTPDRTVQKFTASSCDGGDLVSRAASVASAVKVLFP